MNLTKLQKIYIASRRAELKAEVNEQAEFYREYKLIEYAQANPMFKELHITVNSWVGHDLDSNKCVGVRVRVEGFRDVLPLLEKLADQGYDFNATEDEAAYNQRTYYAPRLKIIASLQGDTENCRRVITGYEEIKASRTPIYSFDCGDPLDMPQANPNPEQVE